MLSHHTHTHTHVRSLSLSLSATRRLHDDPEFCFDWEEHRPFAEAAYRGDKRLHQLLPRLVPKRISEEDFGATTSRTSSPSSAASSLAATRRTLHY